MIVARGSRFWFRIIVYKTLTLSWCAVVIGLINLGLNVEVPARANNVEREFASKDLLGG